LRAVAILVVVAFHAGLPVPGGFVGVDVFFVISGFVITAMLGREWASTGQIRLAHFYARRFKRLTPALALIVFATLLVSLLVLSPLGPIQVATKTGQGAMLLIANAVIADTTGGYFDFAADRNPLLNTWSLSLEEQFYLVFPAALMIGWAIGKRHRALRRAPLLLVAIAGAVSLWMALRGIHLPFLPQWMFEFYGPFARAWEFAAGALLALLIGRVRAFPAWASLPMALAGVGALVASLWLINGSTRFPGPATLLPVTATVLLIAAGAVGRNPVSRLLGSQVMVTTGDLSYSWYLWHWPVIVFTSILMPGRPALLLAVAVLSLAPAWASYRWVEQPIRGKHGLTKPAFTRLVALTVVPPLALSVLILYAADRSFWSDSIARLGAAGASHVSYAAGCMNELPVADRDLTACTWNPSATGTPIFLLGDSNAEHFDEAVIKVGRQTDRPVTIINYGSCPMVDAYLTDSQTNANTDCRDFVVSTVEWLSEQPHGTVVLAAADEYWTLDGFGAGATPESITTDHSGKAAVLTQGLTSVVVYLQAAGHDVVLVQPVPHFVGELPGWSLGDCSLPTILRLGCSANVPQSLVERVQATARGTIDAVAKATGTRVVDPRGLICQDGTCSSERNGTVLYIDAGHLSVAGSRLLTDDFHAAISPSR
jgi:peptidoglycan/LPS O-acetylase OafA/YrhL